jgi:hypothetical protein
MAAGEIHTKPGPKGWRNVAGTRHISNHKNKTLAEKAGRKIAMERGGDHVVHKMDGSVARKVSYRDAA